LERLLARTLQFGTWLASAVIGLGLILALLDGHFGVHMSGSISLKTIALGVVMFILLPVLRVLLMLFVFWQERDYRFSAIAALVLVILILGFVIGMRVSSGAG
jgi:uncharacterized membrane protein